MSLGWVCTKLSSEAVSPRRAAGDVLRATTLPIMGRAVVEATA